MWRGRGECAQLRLGALWLRTGPLSLATKPTGKIYKSAEINDPKVFCEDETSQRQRSEGGKELLLVGECQSNRKGSPNILLALGFLNILVSAVYHDKPQGKHHLTVPQSAPHLPQLIVCLLWKLRQLRSCSLCWKLHFKALVVPVGAVAGRAAEVWPVPVLCLTGSTASLPETSRAGSQQELQQLPPRAVWHQKLSSHSSARDESNRVTEALSNVQLTAC